MQKSSLIVVGLLFAAATCVNAALFTQTLPQRYGGLGLVIGQIVLAAAATVFLNRMLWLRLLVLGTVILFTTGWISACSSLSPLTVGLPLMSVAMVAAAWCGVLRFLGWRLEGLPATNDPSVTPRQFSLATVLIVMTIVGVYLALVRASGMTWEDGLSFVVLCCGLAVPGCLLLLTPARHAWTWLPVIACPLSFGLLYLLGPAVLGELTAGLSASALAIEIVLILVVTIVLQTAGIRLVPSKQSPRVASGRSLSSPAQPLV